MLHELVSGELDIDRMDYLLRDSRECGVVYGIFDAGRILDSLCMYQDNLDKSLHVAIGNNGLAAFEDYLRARQSMYLQVYFHKTAASAEAMLQSLSHALGDWTLPANAHEYAEYDEYNIGTELKQYGKKQFTDMYQLSAFEHRLKNLLFSRRLWKRVYDVSGREDDPTVQERLRLVQDVIAAAGMEQEHVSSLTSLTRFSPRGRFERSKNYLRLIVRDDLDAPRVVPIEDHANIVNNNAKIVIHRVYVEDKVNHNGVNQVDAARQAVNKVFRRMQ